MLRSTTTVHELKLDRMTLIAMLNGEGWKIPDNARIYVTVPTGGDYSGCTLDFDSQTIPVVTWTVTEEQ